MQSSRADTAGLIACLGVANLTTVLTLTFGWGLILNNARIIWHYSDNPGRYTWSYVCQHTLANIWAGIPARDPSYNLKKINPAESKIRLIFRLAVFCRAFEFSAE